MILTMTIHDPNQGPNHPLKEASSNRKLKS
jgi:hypothetical protein